VNTIRAAVAQLARACHARGWAPATSGNFSSRAGSLIAITSSGHDKGLIDARHVMLVDGAGLPAEDTPERPSAETALHVALYRHDERIGAIAHTHSLAAVVLSRRARADGVLVLSGYELAKAFQGVTSHTFEIRVPVVANSQDIPALAAAVEARLRIGGASVPAFLVAGHGAYTWGADLRQVQRHVEALEMLLACALEEARLP
jgi:methylthioribulose-1-phosphate dehydratase